MIKALISDYDGTLVDHTHQLTPTVIKEVKNFQKNGFLFSIATGRMYQGVVAASARALEITQPLIVRGGSEIIDPNTGKVLWSTYIEEETVTSLINFLNLQSNVEFAAESGDFAYTKHGKVETEFGAGTQFADLTKIDKTIIPKVVIFPAYQEKIINQLTVELTNRFPKLHLAKITSRRGYGIDINSHQAGKENALKAWVDLMQLELSEIAGIGDGHNDYPLLINCGYKIAMGNAPDSLKAIADLVVGTQAEDGVAEGMRALTTSSSSDS